MASTTTSAASMLLSGPMTSTDGLINPTMLESTLFPCSQYITLSASAPFPTITLDLTQNPTNNSLQGQFNLFQPILTQKFMPTSNMLGMENVSFPDRVCAATTAMTSDPKFPGALVAAITSIIESNSNCDISGIANGIREDNYCNNSQ
ncbi:WRKY transcription factor 42-like [Vicia villosa]|uniref:WRKY transcription factor 42-like n=1 Tax=Vicia villosa TaxID=3911 RepID=UPI00273CAC93|nr:WRKY transcription factor 42-like [Vicia villosa]